MDGGVAPPDGGPPVDAPPPPDAGRDGGVDASTRSSGICEPCESHGDCEVGSYCVSLTVGGRACLPTCVPDLPSCARGFRCVVDVEAGLDGAVCVPTGGPCCVDEDADGYGDGSGCTDTDCDDEDGEVHPGAPELCDGSDDDCDDVVDEPPTDCAMGRCDAAGDGSYESTEGAVCADAMCTDGAVSSCGLFTCELGGDMGDHCAVSCFDPAGAPDHARCVASAYCDDGGECVPRLPDGGTCARDFECSSGHCENGYCCSGGMCCATVADCPSGSAPLCNDVTTCQGARGDASCDGFRCVVMTGVPDDSGCTSSTRALDCGPFAPVYCTGEEDQPPPACPTSCTDDSECVDGAYCDGVTCVPDLPPGDPCARDEMCGAGLSCVAGVCCTSASCDDGDACTQDLCTGGSCVNPGFCAGTATSCGCGTCSDCTASDGWYDTGASYACCNGGESCTCQDQELRAYACSGTGCTYTVTSTRTQRTGCALCDDGDACTTDTCSSGTCSAASICAGTATSCGCASCTDCTASTGWYEVGTSYACCNGGQSCTCQDREFRTYTCGGTSCSYTVTSTDVVRTGCSTCDDSSACTTDSCVAGVCQSTAICAGTATSCGCSSCSNCSAADNWYDVGSTYACCDGGSACSSCQNQEFRTHTCAGTSCTYSVTSTRVLRTGCSVCNDGNSCTADACSAGACTSAPHCAGTTASCGCTSCLACTGGMICSGTTCQCPSGQTSCGGTCRNLASDRNNCGACGAVCPTGASCSAGMCHYGNQTCPAGQFATGFDAAGTIQCSTMDALARAAVNSRCHLYYGWRDSCGGTCSSAPSKWGSTNSASCTVGAGTNSSCGVYSLGGASVRMLGLNTDGDVDDNDRFYHGLYCTDGAAGSLTATGTCPAGYFITQLHTDGSFTCTAAERAIVDYVRSDCRFYAGWIDSCDNCSSVPSRSGWASQDSCGSATGGNNTCDAYVLGGTTVRLYGLNTGGDVNGDDKFHVGFHCVDHTGTGASSGLTSCATGSFVSGVTSSNTLTCAPAANQVDAPVRAGCSVYSGWRDSCDSCSTVPSKWGRASSVACANGAGGDDTCQTYTLAGRLVPLFGLNTDGDVNDDDKFYLGLLCQ